MVTTLFLDIGGVSLTDGWGQKSRTRTAKPDSEIFRLALDISQVPERQIVYVKNTPMFDQIAEGLGIRRLESLGLELDEKRNAANNGPVSGLDCPIGVHAIHTDEESTISKMVCGVLGLAQ